MPPLKEACVESLAEAKKAALLGADRLELCARLDLEGLSPSLALIQQVLEVVSIPVRVMVRPRAGDFSYSLAEKKACFQEIINLKDLGIEGIVLGAIDERGGLDIPFIMECYELVQPLRMTVHKAIDVTINPLEELKKLQKEGFEGSVLSSGAAKTAEKGAILLQKMLAFAERRITIIPAGKVTKDNFDKIHSLLRADIYHGRQIIGDLNL